MATTRRGDGIPGQGTSTTSRRSPAPGVRPPRRRREGRAGPPARVEALRRGAPDLAPGHRISTGPGPGHRIRDLSGTGREEPTPARGRPSPIVCVSHRLRPVDPSLEAAVTEWHASVNGGDAARAARAVGDPVVVLGPRGAGPITPEQFARWVERSGITLVPRSWHPVGERLVVVEEDAGWPGSPAPTRVATVFRVAGGKVTAALRLPDLTSALELARVCRAMAATG